MKKFAVLIGLIIILNPFQSALADDHTQQDDSQQVEEILDGPVPAILIEEPPEQPEDVDWTYRYLIPTTVAIATLVVCNNFYISSIN